MFEKLCACPLFKGLDQEEIGILFEKIDYQIIEFKKNDIIVREEDPCHHLLIILKGSVRGEMMDFSGKVIKIEDIESCRPLAPAFLFGNKKKYPVTIVANEDISLLKIPESMVIELFQKNRLFLTHFLNMISNRAQFLSQKIKFLSFQTIKGKVAHYIMQLSKEKNSEWVILTASQKEMAEMFGVTRPALGRAIREMDQQGLIEAKGKSIKIMDKERLISLFR